jgi:hypothetical protein
VDVERVSGEESGEERRKNEREEEEWGGTDCVTESPKKRWRKRERERLCVCERWT